MDEWSEVGGRAGTALALPSRYRRLSPIHLPFTLFSILSSIILLLLPSPSSPSALRIQSQIFLGIISKR